ncbi:RagB/SusD family nutrient uptake outer membrane protein [Chitinophaga horti]|uniref:RagB/SusD family nutrient uptake outer membrane protein n=1 Tax=Chitinophaga horti TaxID=2920382 RepID=A0ABY6J858_9BACT|nr:RagB/SusD family nutrient uptake outer membrane protein [Chitinophaga horti]UYQ95873.1 RagB/SusD family nutrient uptake outer membrane protein [Chitinophaga horti]
MKLYHKLIAFAALALTSACTDLDLPVENELTPDNFPKTEEQLVLATGSAYSKLRPSYCVHWWYLQTLVTDEAILPARAGNWYDGARFQQEHLHTWNQTHSHIGSAWRWGFGIISNCNQLLSLFQQAPESPSKEKIAAEVRALRALSFFHMMDLFGDIPVNTSFGDTALPTQRPRKEVFAFIEQELKAVMPLLSADVNTDTYGRMTKFGAAAILAKMYLNAQVYAGENRYDDAVAMCDTIIASGKFALTEDFKSIFAANNGPHIKEIIFAIPFDWSQGKGQQYTWFGLHYALQKKYGLAYLIDGPVSTLPEYYENFNEPNDVRTQAWLTGKQYDNDGQPILIKTTKRGMDASYTGADGTTPIDYHLEFTPNVTLTNPNLFEVGGDELGKAKGYRSIKYSPDVSAVTRDASNDVPVFRYADILLMKAEAILRGAAATRGESALGLVNQLRTIRKATPFNSITLEELLPERARELSWEAWRRNDLIRFGKYEDSWGYKTNKDEYRRVYPIPASEIILNPKLNQHLGYRQ